MEIKLTNYPTSVVPLQDTTTVGSFLLHADLALGQRRTFKVEHDGETDVFEGVVRKVLDGEEAGWVLIERLTEPE